MLVRISHNNWMVLEQAELYYQNNNTNEVICKISEAPPYDHDEVNDIIPQGFIQVRHKGSLGENLNLESIQYIYGLKERIGTENANKADTLTELELLYNNALLEDEVDTLALEILALKGV